MMKFTQGSIIVGNKKADLHYAVTTRGTRWIVLQILSDLPNKSNMIAVISDVPCVRKDFPRLSRLLTRDLVFDRIDKLVQENPSEFRSDRTIDYYDVNSDHFDLIGHVHIVSNQDAIPVLKTMDEFL